MIYFDIMYFLSRLFTIYLQFRKEIRHFYTLTSHLKERIMKVRNIVMNEIETN